MSIGTIILIILVIALLGGFSGIGGGPFYGTGYYGGGGLGLIIVIILILVLLGRILGRVGKGASAPCPPTQRKWWARFRSAHPTKNQAARMKTTHPSGTRMSARPDFLARTIATSPPASSSPP